MSVLHESELLELRAETPADRQRIRQVVDEAIRVEKLSAGRVVLVGLLAFLGGTLWLFLVFPQILRGWRFFFEASWLLAAIVLAAVTIAESIGRRRLRRLAGCKTDGDLAVQPATHMQR